MVQLVSITLSFFPLLSKLIGLSYLLFMPEPDDIRIWARVFLLCAQKHDGTAAASKNMLSVCTCEE